MSQKQETETILELPLGKIHDSPFQPRTVYDQEHLAEVAETMKPPHGRVLQPIRVRPAPYQPGEWETIFGHQRRRAAALAGRSTVPSIVCDWDDEQVKYAQVVENLKRKGVSPIEEADALHELKTTHGASIEQLMERSGMKRSAVYNRLRLAVAHSEVREAVLAEGVDAELAQEVARLPKPLQPAALRAVRHMSVRNAIAELRHRFQYKLASAPFDVLDIRLVPDTVACDACTKRSDREPVLLEECGPNVCMDGECYARKAEAAQAAERKKAADASARDKAAEPPPAAKRKAEKTTQQGGFDFDGEGGDAAAEVDAGSAPATRPAAERKAADDPRPPEVQAVTRLWPATLKKLAAVIAATPRSIDDLRLLIRARLEDYDSLLSPESLEVMGWAQEMQEAVDEEELTAHKIATASADQLATILMIEVLSERTFFSIDKEEEERLAVCKRYGIDPVQASGYEPPKNEAQAEIKTTPAPKGAKYRCPETGSTWSGKGLKPKWLQVALGAGKTLKSFEVAA